MEYQATHLTVTGAAEGPPTHNLRLWMSDTRGKTWLQPLQQTLGDRGKFYTTVSFKRLGMARDRVFALEWQADTRVVLLGAMVQVEAGAT